MKKKIKDTAISSVKNTIAQITLPVEFVVNTVICRDAVDAKGVKHNYSFYPSVKYSTAKFPKGLVKALFDLKVAEKSK